MQIILSDKDISEFMEIFLKSGTLRKLLHVKLQQADEAGEVEDSAGEEKLIIINTDKIESRKKRGRPRKNLKNSDVITIENENIELEI
jgi:hypothetical protein